jgi:hypothetical protein
MIRAAVDGALGYSKLALKESELSLLREGVNRTYDERIALFAPDVAEKFRQHPIERYHEIDHLLDHKRAWPKAARLLPFDVAQRVHEMEFFLRLEEEFGSLDVSNEEGLLPEEMTWRLVRPNYVEDVGPIHADKWFWDLGHGRMPPGCARLKIWIPLIAEPGRNGLKVVPGSHLRNDWRYHGEMRDGFVKPVLDEDETTLATELLDLKPGDVLAFHDALLHGGAVNHGKQCRVSLEFTCLFRM